MAVRFFITMKNFGHIISLVCVKQLLGPMRSLVACLQGNFGFKKVEEIIHSFKQTRKKAVELSQSAHAEGVTLVNEFHIE